jgi:hypothetical protein
MRFAIKHLKRNLHEGIQRVDFLCREIGASVESQAVKPSLKKLIVGKSCRSVI